MKTLRAIFCVLALLCVGVLALAYPSLLGPTGGANLPVAEVAKQGSVQVAASYYDTAQTITQTNINGLDLSRTESRGSSVPIRVLYGIARNTEVGATYVPDNTHVNYVFLGQPSSTFQGLSDVWTVNAKYLIPAQTPEGISFAAGGVLQNYINFTGNDLLLYGVATRYFTRTAPPFYVVRTSLGVNWTRLSQQEKVIGLGNTTTDLVSAESGSAFRPFVDMELGFPNGLTFTAEYQLPASTFKSIGREQAGIASLAIRYKATPYLMAEAGVSNAYRGIFGTNHYGVFAGLDYLWQTSTEE